MEVTITLPEDILAALEGRWGDVSRRSLEAIAVEACCSGALNEGQVRRVLQFDTRFQVHALLKAHHVPLRYTAADPSTTCFWLIRSNCCGASTAKSSFLTLSPPS